MWTKLKDEPSKQIKGSRTFALTENQRKFQKIKKIQRMKEKEEKELKEIEKRKEKKMLRLLKLADLEKVKDSTSRNNNKI